ncbi:MAG: hypothetical protein LBD96_04925 [Treponema sp.]|jgi:hypothetical protein|nr:hypothetical protein [Treponema sp.]
MKHFAAVFLFVICMASCVTSRSDFSDGTSGVFKGAPRDYNLAIGAASKNGNIVVTITNNNKFTVNDLDVSITGPGGGNKIRIGSIAGESIWTLGDTTTDYKDFVPAAYYEGYPNVDIFDHPHARVSPDTDPDSLWETTIEKKFDDLKTTVKVTFVRRGPRIMFSGHSFTGYWDSSYYYVRQLAKEAGWNAQIAYAYFGGTGIANFANLSQSATFTPKAGRLTPFEQNKKVFEANEYYDYYIVAGGSDEAVTTENGAQDGSSPYTQRNNMLAGAKILYALAKEKGARMLLWCPRGQRYGFYYDRFVRPQVQAKAGEVVTVDTDGDGKPDTKLTQTLSSRGLAHKNADWYEEMARQVYAADPSFVPPVVAHVGTAFDYITTYYAGKIDPYWTDNAHQNNIGNYISACVYYTMIFGDTPEGLGIPKSNTTDPEAGVVTPEQAAIIQEVAWKVVSGQYTLAGKPYDADEVYMGAPDQKDFETYRKKLAAALAAQR